MGLLECAQQINELLRWVEVRVGRGTVRWGKRREGPIDKLFMRQATSLHGCWYVDVGGNDLVLSHSV